MSEEFKKRLVTSIFLITLLILMYIYSYILIVSLIVIAIITWVEFYAIISKIFSSEIFKDRFLRIIFKAISLTYLSTIVFIIIKYQTSYLSVFITYSVLVAIASDIGGLVIGKTLKGRKLTSISPKKTISGSLGAFIFSLLLIPFFIDSLLINSFLLLFFITLVISLASQTGDLFISLLKRKAKVKDTSDILPGHGGFLDRIDGIIFAIPVGLILFSFLK
tara:strand:+ start:121 stop:780 length:660 start_codon:yes stop_codon:yes gene_type:complete